MGQSFRTIRASALLLCAVWVASSSPYAAANAWGVGGMSGMSGSYMAPCPSPVTQGPSPCPSPMPSPVAATPSPCPSPMPSPCPSPMPSPVAATPSPCPSPMPSPCPSPMPSPVKVATPSPCPSPMPSPVKATPSPCPSPMPSPCPSPMPSPVKATPSPCPSPMPSPVQTGPRCGSGYCPMGTQCCSYFSGKYTSCCPMGTQCCGDKCCAPSDKCYLEYYKWWKVMGSCEKPMPSPLPSPVKLAPSPCPSPMPSPCPSPMPSPVKLAPSPCPSPMPSPCPSPMPSPVELAPSPCPSPMPSPCPSPMPSPVELAPSPCPSPMPSPCPSPMPSPVKLAPSPCPSPMPSPCPSPVAAPKPHYNFAAKLTGMMCGKKAKAHGVVKGYYDMENELLAGYIELYDIKAVTQVHFHIGAAGVNGPVLAWIWPLDTKKITTQPFTTSDWSVMFTINATDITFNTTSSPPVANFAQLVSAIQKSNIYVNVHTIQHPDGEIRGQTYRYYD